LLMAIAAFVPLGRLIQIGLGLQPFRVTEAVVLAFFAGWLAKPRSDHDGPRVPATPAWLLAAILGASVVAQMWSVASIPGELPGNLRTLYQGYFLVPDRIGFGAAALTLEGLGLMAATATLFRARPRLANAVPIAMVSSAVVAAVASALLYRGIGFAPVLEEHASIVGRTSAHVGDPNAAASYFGMVLFVAAGMAGALPPAAERTMQATLLYLPRSIARIRDIVVCSFPESEDAEPSANLIPLAKRCQHGHGLHGFSSPTVAGIMVA